MKSRHTLPTVVTNQWTQDQSTNDPSQRRHTGNLDSWSVNAKFWDTIVGEGNDMYHELVLPAVDELADVQPDDTVLDLATGTGLAARRHQLKVAGGSGRVVASDGCAELLEFARTRERQGLSKDTGKTDGEIEYFQLDLMDEVQLMKYARENEGFVPRFHRCRPVVLTFPDVLMPSRLSWPS